ncbi:MAG: aminopeptidase P family protein [Chloroflexota bacterium]|nr:aminopeptidase P family protein [Chloroflexota bacterium]
MNTTRAQAVLADARVDVVVGTTYANVFYLTGYVGFSQRLMPTTQVYAIARADRLDEPVLVAPIGDLDMHAQLPARIGRLRSYGHFYVQLASEERDPEQRRYQEIVSADPGGSAAEALLEELGALPSSARVALDERGVTAAVRDAVRARFGERVVDGAALLDRVRMVKTPEEIRRLEAAALVMEGSIARALEAAREGISEAEMARVFDTSTIAAGSAPYFTVIAFGERGALPNTVPSAARRLRRGDQIRFDVGCYTEMYASDISRTAVLGAPAPKVRGYYEAILAGEQRMLEVMKPGVRAREVFDAAVRATQEAGIPHYRRHHVGHGVGLDVYDLPIIAPGSETPLEPGMVFEIETPYYEIGFGGVQVEDTVVITESGCRLLTRSSRELAVIA